ncbi:uncharacterized protein LOC105701985 [Orussus abietinus]|uniref:uncharacterized protein LOC105701985 n=1 Tax=Orussus abietinus TaxID=222816 RepID=UPI000625009E|nr:uncharacterized protein LOC105701985 [Orussus abietinus]
MLKKVLGKSGRRILRAFKKLSERCRKSKKERDENFDDVARMKWISTLEDPDAESLAWSLASFDARSVDTFVTFVAEGMDECPPCCYWCIEHEENQKNENRENEMII